jgi:hypothetical protein
MSTTRQKYHKRRSEFHAEDARRFYTRGSDDYVDPSIDELIQAVRRGDEKEIAECRAHVAESFGTWVYTLVSWAVEDALRHADRRAADADLKRRKRAGEAPRPRKPVDRKTRAPQVCAWSDSL